MSDRAAGLAPSRITAVLGPTNTGKTHLAVERMLGHASGMIGLPLRLLAREIYERIVRQRGAAAVALITGEEKIVPPRPHYFVCTVEAMPMERSVEFLAVDEIQLAADPERGHVFTQRLLHARGRFETMFLGAGTMEPLMRRLVPDVEIVTRDRLSTLSYAGSKKLTRLPRRSAIVAFSTERVYAIAELIRRQRSEDVNMKAAETFSFNDFASNGGILIAGGLVLWLDQSWPDLVVGLIVAGIAVKGGVDILRDSRAETRAGEEA